MTATLTIADYLKYANLQMAAEALYGFDATPLDANLTPGAIRENWELNTNNNLTTGNLHASKFSATQVELSGLATDWIVVEHKSNTATGFSGTLFKAVRDNPVTGVKAGELVMSFRSTEFIDDTTRDSQATNSLEIDDYGWAFGQIDDMETWYASLQQRGKIDAPLSVTGYSLGGHLATAFNLLHLNVAQQVVTFNGAGVGEIKADQGNLTSVMQYFRELRTQAGAIAAKLDTALRTVYTELNAEWLQVVGGLSAVDGVRALAEVAAYGAQVGERLGAIAAPADQIAMIKDALARAGKVFVEAHRAPQLASGITEGSAPAKPADIPDDAIAQMRLDYQMAVLFAGKRTDGNSQFEDGLQSVFGRDFVN